MKSIKYIAGLVILVIITTTVQAQNKTLLQSEVMAKQLALSDKQKADLDKELKASKAEREEMQKRIKAFHEEMKRDAFVKRQEREEKLKSILTPEQFTKFQEMRKKTEMRQRAQQGNQKRLRMRGPQQRQGARQFQGRGLQERQRALQGRGNGPQFQRRGAGQERFLQMLGNTPEERQATMKKFQEFLKQEKEKNGGN